MLQGFVMPASLHTQHCKTTDTSGVLALQLRMVGSTFRLLPEAEVMAKFLPLDTISLRYVAWEVLVEV